MTQSRVPAIVYILAAGLIAGLVGGFTAYWGRMTVFPVYGYVIDLLAFLALAALILRARKLKIQTSDEFSVVKKRLATQQGFLIGAILFVLSGFFPYVLPHVYHGLMLSLGSPEDGYAIGRLAGFAPFVIGLLVGQVMAWLKYR